MSIDQLIAFTITRHVLYTTLCITSGIRIIHTAYPASSTSESVQTLSWFCGLISYAPALGLHLALTASSDDYTTLNQVSILISLDTLKFALIWFMQCLNWMFHISAMDGWHHICVMDWCFTEARRIHKSILTALSLFLDALILFA